MFWSKAVFWTSCFIIFYNYAGYAFIVFILNRFRKQTASAPESFYPSVSFIVAAYNEEDCIQQKIENCFLLNYPKELLEFIFITDGSTDTTPSIVSKYPEIKLLHETDRKGKSAALLRAVAAAKNEILIFNDANTTLNLDAIKKIVQHYSDPKTGGVAGEKRVVSSSGGQNSITANEGLYWKYESALKQLDSDFFSVVGAAGELFSIRRHLFEPVPHNVILDDFIISMRVAAKGYRIIYEKDAYASELPSATISDERKRKIRIAAGGIQSIIMLKGLFKFWKHPNLFFLYFSHRVLRWTLTPVCLVTALISNVLIIFTGGHGFWAIVFFIQLLFYGLALIASLESPDRSRFKLAKLAYYFVFMNLSVFLGFARYIRGKQASAWEKASRAK